MARLSIRGFVSCVVACAAVEVSRGEDPARQFLETYRPAVVRQREQLAYNISFRATSVEYSANGKPSTTTAYEYLANRESIKTSYHRTFHTDKRTPLTGTVLLRPDGYFSIGRPTETGGYVIHGRKLGRFSPADVDWSLAKLPYQDYAGLAEKLRDGQRVTAYEPATADRQSAKLIVSTPYADGVYATTYIFNVQDNWTLDQFTRTLADGSRYHGKYTYVKYGETSVPQRYETFITKPGAAPRKVVVEEYTAFQWDSPTDSEFALAQFGLPEPDWDGTIPMYLWLIGAAVLFAGVAFIFRRLARRRTPAPAAKPAGS